MRAPDYPARNSSSHWHPAPRPATPTHSLRRCLAAWLLACAAAAAAGTVSAACKPQAEASGALGRLAGLGGRLAAQLGAPELAREAAEALAGADGCDPSAAAQSSTSAGANTGTAPAASRPRLQLPKLTVGQGGGRNCGALGAGCADGMTPLVNCMKEKSFWSETALALERKRDAGGGYSAVQRAEIDADIAAMWEAHRDGSSGVTPVDPARPNRHQDWFSGEEQGQLNTAIAQTINSHRQYCNSRYAKF